MTTINNGGGVNPQMTQKLQNLEQAEAQDRELFEDGATTFETEQGDVKGWTKDQFMKVGSVYNDKKTYTAADFARADTNGDGRLTEAEFMKARGMDRLLRTLSDDFNNWSMNKIMEKLSTALRG